ncbi:MAG TPA: hypothetical protein PKY59_00805 [Pyrinomonadaceae bacterium]|nr:hypothetical protein [Pyrinomonadaceae bacterium]
MSIKLQEPIANGSLKSTYFFNGRLVTGTDLTREQEVRREAVRRIGQAAGSGIAFGLEVEKDFTAGNDPIVNVYKGLAVNGCGQALYLAQDENVNLLERFGSQTVSSNIFGDCQPLATGTYTAGYGLYLLVLSPAQKSEGSAPTSGLNNAFSTCNTDVIWETAQFRLLAIDPFLSGEDLSNQLKLRNYLTYRCFGVEKTQNLFANPLKSPIKKYGLIDEMRVSALADSDVPLAIINWTASGIRFVEMWAVRRRLTEKNDAENWKQLLSDRRKAETEAAIQQFSDQIAQMERDNLNLSQIVADDYFVKLPPVGIIPSNRGSQNGFDPNVFFGNRYYGNEFQINGNRLRDLLNLAVNHEPVELNNYYPVQLFTIRENIEAFDSGENVKAALIFASTAIQFYYGYYA